MGHLLYSWNMVCIIQKVYCKIWIFWWWSKALVQKKKKIAGCFSANICVWVGRQEAQGLSSLLSLLENLFDASGKEVRAWMSCRRLNYLYARAEFSGPSSKYVGKSKWLSCSLEKESTALHRWFGNLLLVFIRAFWSLGQQFSLFNIKDNEYWLQQEWIYCCLRI